MQVFISNFLSMEFRSKMYINGSFHNDVLVHSLSINLIMSVLEALASLWASPAVVQWPVQAHNNPVTPVELG